MEYLTQYNKIFTELGKSKIMVLSTSLNDLVTSRTMSIVIINNQFYFQTDKNFRKYEQIINNHHVALCYNNIQIEGICEELGKPYDNELFCKVYQECFNNSYNKYSKLENERLFIIKPTYIKKWLYIDSIPYIEILNIVNQTYSFTEYIM